ncbi:Tyrosine recombinase XerC [Peribacillus simplex]|uniref:site-specific integrase n=1 Tax=Peribacillus simplex TaxID=1478 RepID=UPI001DB02CF7|nr:site-specific integrase [Peribacillus simplex]CAH0177838.1 Tyrosine recombinase XerC [Peribacillus simplex]
MASFQKYTTKQGQMWMFKLDTGVNPETGKRQTTTRRGFKTKKEAQQAVSRVEQELANGISLNNNNLTYKDVFDQWFANHSKTIKASTKKSIESKFNKHVLPRFGKLKMKEITRPYCQKMINEIAQLITSVNDIKIQANQVFKYALKMDIISRNPLEHVTIPRQQKDLINDDNEVDERNYWKKDEIKNFLTITKQELSFRDHVLFHLLIYTGARKGEILALTWDDIDYEAGSTRFAKTLFHNKGEFIFQTSKTKESRRLISLDTKTLSLLKKWRIRQIEADLANASKYDGNKMVFTRDDGSPLRLAYPNEKLDIVIKKHQLHRITIHGLRHTHASLLFEAGASIKEVQERLGHSDIQMTMNIYTHVTDYLKEQTAVKFQRYIEL